MRRTPRRRTRSSPTPPTGKATRVGSKGAAWSRYHARPVCCAPMSRISLIAACGRPASVRSKTDQAGEGQEIAIPRGYHLRPVEMVQMWLAHAAISTGPVFRQVDRGGNVSNASLGEDGYCKMLK